MGQFTLSVLLLAFAFKASQATLATADKIAQHRHMMFSLKKSLGVGDCHESFKDPFDIHTTHGITNMKIITDLEQRAFHSTMKDSNLLHIMRTSFKKTRKAFSEGTFLKFVKESTRSAVLDSVLKFVLSTNPPLPSSPLCPRPYQRQNCTTLNGNHASPCPQLCALLYGMSDSDLQDSIARYKAVDAEYRSGCSSLHQISSRNDYFRFCCPVLMTCTSVAACSNS